MAFIAHFKLLTEFSKNLGEAFQLSFVYISLISEKIEISFSLRLKLRVILSHKDTLLQSEKVKFLQFTRPYIKYEFFIL